MPNGVRFLRRGNEPPPPPIFHSFVITREDGSQKYGGCLTYYSKVVNEGILHSLQVGLYLVTGHTSPDVTTMRYNHYCISLACNQGNFIGQYIIYLGQFYHCTDRKLIKVITP